MRRWAPTLALLLLPWAGAWAAAEEGETSCVACHSDPEWFDEEGLAVVASHRSGVHAAVGLSCHDCHGGNPSPDVADDLDLAMDAGFAANPFVGVPAKAEIPSFCGRCHSDPEMMKRFRPDARVDQEAEYRTSRHGKALAAGDTAVATCTDCHGVHGILRADDPASPVYPTRVADTCSTCHSDAERMAGRVSASGRPLPVDQYARWRQSVHAAALLDREDLSAPTCNDCHGNHGAAPPGLTSVAFVCGQCHGREAELFRASEKHALQQEHNELMEGEAGCDACHEAPEPQAALTALPALTECSSCHGNHGIIRASVAMLAPLPDTPCAFCHEGPGTLDADSPEPEKAARSYETLRDELLAEGRGRGLEGTALFDWLVERVPQVPPHLRSTGSGAAPAQPRESFARLFAKFRLGSTGYSYDDPVSGEAVHAAVTRCTDCHAAEPVLAEAPVGLETAAVMVQDLRELSVLTARAERVLVRAQRGGVETRAAEAALDQAVDSAVELEVLVHTFDVAAGGRFAEKHAEGVVHAKKALEEGYAAGDELEYRRRGLAVFLGLVLLVLVGLGSWIRRLG
ncbi:MAG: cytochrome c3 family protein [Thermoanaerobaculia bacterium]